MQETRYFDEDGGEQSLVEIFQAQPKESEDALIERMNQRLFALEDKGHVLVQQKSISLSEKLAIERAKKAKKKLNRMKRVTK